MANNKSENNIMQLSNTIVKIKKTSFRSEMVDSFEEKQGRTRKSGKVQRGKLRSTKRNWEV